MTALKKLLPSKQIAGKVIGIVIAITISAGFLGSLVTSVTNAQAQVSAGEAVLLGSLVLIVVAGIVMFVVREFKLDK